MAKKKAAAAAVVVPKPTPIAVVFPELSEKNHIQCDTFLEDQVLLLNVCLSRCSPTLASRSNIFQNVFTPAECRSFVDFIDRQPLELTPHKKRGEADRVNCRSLSAALPSSTPSRHRQSVNIFARVCWSSMDRITAPPAVISISCLGDAAGDGYSDGPFTKLEHSAV